MKREKLDVADYCKALRGIFRFNVYRHAGGEKELIEAFEDENLIVNLAREQMARLIAGDAGMDNRVIKQISFGVNGADADFGDTDITNPFTKNLNGFEFPSPGQVRFGWGLSVTEANGKAVREFGLLTADGKLFARRVRASAINKEPDISLEGTWTIVF